MERDVWPSAIGFLSRRCHGDTKSRNGRNLLFQDVFKRRKHLGSRAKEPVR